MATATMDSMRGGALQCAAYYGHLAVVALLVEKGCPLNHLNFNRETATHICAGRNFVEVLYFLVESGANVHLADGTGQTPLHRAAWGGSAKLPRCSWTRRPLSTAGT